MHGLCWQDAMCDTLVLFCQTSLMSNLQKLLCFVTYYVIMRKGYQGSKALQNNLHPT